MKLLCDYRFEDGVDIKNYFITVSDLFSGEVVIKNGILLFTPPEGFNGELLFSPVGISDYRTVIATLYGAKGDGAFGGFSIQNSDYADVTELVEVHSLGSIILHTLNFKPFEFSGYKIEIE